MDNCEHLVEASAELANTLLRGATRLKMLITSREALGLPGETTYRVPSLTIPPLEKAPEVKAVDQYEAVALFLDRAKAVVTDFQLTSANIAPMVRICQRLDGIPLAIELAAVRTASLEVTQIAERLDHAFQLLAGGSRAALERHRTLRATVDWSYNLLSDAERILLQRLSVFAGGWTLEAAEAVCAGDAVEEAEVLELLSQLVNKSMLTVERIPETGLRYRMLETIRQYAADKIVEAGESERLRNCHLAYFVIFAERLEDGLRGPELVRRLNRLEMELENFRLALAWGLQTNVLSELRLASALMWFWHIHSSHGNEGLAWLQQGLEAEATSHNHQGAGWEVQTDTYRVQVLAKALSATGVMVFMRREEPPKAIALFEQSLALYRGLDGDQRWGIAFAMFWLGFCYAYMGNSALAYSMVVQSKALFEEIGDKNRVGDCLQILGYIEIDQQRFMQISLAEMAIQKESGDIDGIATAAQQLGFAARYLGDYQGAIRWFQESLAGYRQVGNRWGMANQLGNMGFSAWYHGDYIQARLYYSQAASLYRDVGDTDHYTRCIIWQSQVFISTGHYDQAREILETTVDLKPEFTKKSILAVGGLTQAKIDWLQGNIRRASWRVQESSVIISELDNTFGIISLQQHLSGWIGLNIGDFRRASVCFIEGLEGSIQANDCEDKLIFLNDLASLAVRCGDMERAARLFGASEVMFPELVNTLSPIERGWREQDIHATRLALGEEGYRTQSDLGRGMTLEQAVGYALEEEQ
jgi:predicted ATPase